MLPFLSSWFESELLTWAISRLVLFIFVEIIEGLFLFSLFNIRFFFGKSGTIVSIFNNFFSGD